jgi:hypothetical protein
MIHKMLDLMATSPQLQEMMMSALPKFMRRPEVIKSMLANPDARSQIANMMVKQVGRLMMMMLSVLQRTLLLLAVWCIVTCIAYPCDCARSERAGAVQCSQRPTQPHMAGCTNRHR